jgi:hypothetical protein
MPLRTTTLDGKRIAYTSETVFLVQVGRYSKGAYKTRYSVVGDIGQAVHLYRSVNIGNGYKKRIFVPTFNKPVLAKAAS